MSEFLAGVLLGFFIHYIIDALKAVKDIRDLHNRVAIESEKHFKGEDK